VDCSFFLDPENEKMMVPMVKTNPKISFFAEIGFSLDRVRKLKMRTPKNLEERRMMWRT
jgi:hypothetical protein